MVLGVKWWLCSSNFYASEETISRLKDEVYEKCAWNKSEIELKFSYFTYICDHPIGPIYLKDEKCLQTYLLLGDANNRPLLHVEIKEKVRIIFYNNVDSEIILNGHDDSGGSQLGLFVDNVCNDDCEFGFRQDNVCGCNVSDDCDDYVDTELYPDEHFDGAFIVKGIKETDVEENLNDYIHCRETQGGQSEFQHCESIDNDDQNFALLSSSCEQIYNFTDESNLSVGKEFDDKKDVQRELYDIAIKASFEMRVIKSTKTLYEVRCVDETCSWKVRVARKEDSSRFSVRTYCNKHTCDLTNRKRRHRQASAVVVADMLVENFRGQQKLPALKAIQTMMQNKGVEISYFKAWKGKQLAINQLRGDPVESFKLLPAYLYMLEQVNAGSTTYLKLNPDNSFKYMFLAYKACIAGFKYMRKVISVDGTHLTCKYKGVLLIATAQDGNHHQYPIAWAVVDVESEESWTWFFERLHDLILDDNELVFISDRHRGIINGLASVYKQAKHGHCIWHLGQNIKTRLKSKAGGVALFMCTAKAYRQTEFNELYDEMRKGYPSITGYLEGNIDQQKWARAHFHGSRYNIMTTNGSESINSKLVFARELPVVALLDAIQNLIMSWFNSHRKAAAASTRHLTPWAEKIVRTRFIESQKMKVVQMNTSEYHVTEVGHDVVVDLNKRICRCRVFDIDRLPCAHAIAAASHQNMDIYELCSHYYSTNVWNLAYVETIYPMPPSKEWNVPADIDSLIVLPPKVKVRKGRVKKKRIPSIGEFGSRKKKSIV
ncbi:uncharacterized protein [Henckelia pumila]|uniref:uncharacterized protein n=1 Tax=Henckelia pumila TaxID=405737 RepID=UPI003C6DDE2F